MKRDNWTNDEVIDIIKGMMLDERHGDPCIYSYNDTLMEIIDEFKAFKLPLDISGAMAYDEVSKFKVHVGPLLPE